MSFRIITEFQDQCNKTVSVDEVFKKDEVRIRISDMGVNMVTSRMNRETARFLMGALQQWLGHEHQWKPYVEGWLICNDCQAQVPSTSFD